MRPLATTALVIVCSLLLAASSLAQPLGPDLRQDYRDFLEQHKDMSASELLAMHPAGNFRDDVGLPWESVLHRDLIDARYSLTPYEKSLLEKNAFVVTERLRDDSFFEHLLQIWRDDLPLFISTDAILHGVHFYYGLLLSDIEYGALRGRLSDLLTGMHENLPVLFAQHASDPDLRPMVEDVDLYLTVARRLLGEESVGVHFADDAEVDRVLGLIDAEGLASYSLFAETCRQIDFSQFTPRGHYTEMEELQQYFRAMMWLGRIELYLLPPENVAGGPCPSPTPEDVQRQTIDAVLLLELMDLAEVNEVYAEMEDVLSFLVGEQDNATVTHLRSVLDSAGVEDARELLDAGTLQTFQETLKTKPFAYQRILSQVLMSDPSSPESVQPASAFLLFGQRFIIDSYITGNVVYDKTKSCRLYPSTLDVLAGLGNNVAIELLVPELEQYHYASNLAALRYLVDSHSSAFWESSFYNAWLNSIRLLNPPENRENLPLFMQTAAWWHQKMNTQLSSWIELRRDNLLYAKPSYTAGYVCSYPSAYVEPFPEFFQNLNRLAAVGRARFSELSFSEDWLKGYVLQWYEVLEEVSGMLGTIAQKELDGTPLAEEEITYMQEMLYRGAYGVLCGWYMRLLYGYCDTLHPSDTADYLVCDYHTTPTDCGGSMIGAVSHAGTGPVELAIVTAQAPDAPTAAFVGPVMSYYEYRTTGFQRLTDEEWETTYLSQATRPAWVSSYLANESGERYE
jgi:hypothetical protein